MSVLGPTTCRSCKALCRPDDRFCRQCGQPDPTIRVGEQDTIRIDPESGVGTGSSTGPGSGQIADAPLGPGTVFAHRYRVERILGQGGMGQVYHAVDIAIDEPIALKILSSSLGRDGAILDQFKRELKLARRIRHRNVVASFHLGEWHGHSYITQEYIDAENLSALIARRGPLGEVEALRTLRQVLRGLKAAHELAIVHRDIKASNILVNKDGVAFITDFGLAVTSAHSVGRDMAGTPQYMAPELSKGEVATPASDLYACGILLFLLLTGRFPLPGRHLEDALNAHATVNPMPIPALLPVSAPTRRIYEQMLAKDPYARPQRVGEVLEIFEQVLAVGALSARSGKPVALIADPDTKVRGFAREVLESEGYQVEEADTASAVLDRAFAYDPAMVVLDSNLEGGEAIGIGEDAAMTRVGEILPRHGALRLCRVLQRDARLRQVPILITTEQRHMGIKPAFTLMGASEVIPKPFTREEFAAGAKRARGAALARSSEA